MGGSKTVKVVVTEKPSVARDLALFLGAKNKCEGYFEGAGYQVTWAFGHLVALKEPEEYDPALKKWSLATLPFIPKSFELKLIENRGISKQFKVIQKLVRLATELIAATDAGREGELIFRYILSMSGAGKKPFQRLWLSSLTEDAIQKAFASLRPGSDYDLLYEAAKCRSESDWIVGLNATRNLTVRYGKKGLLWSVGRVQTPVLAMLVQRDEEIASFVPKPFWELKTRYKEVVFKWKGGRFLEEGKAQVIFDKVKGKPFAIEKVESKEEKNLPPLLYDLTELQRDMNRRYGMSAGSTLEIAQALYEGKLISYPRTDARFLSSDMKGEAVSVLRQLQKIKGEEISRLDLGHLSFSSRIFNNEKVSDHHAIIPTGKTSSSLALPSQRVFDAIVTRFIAVFYPPCIKNVTTVEGSVEQELFQAKGVQVLSAGWTALYGKEEDEEKGKEEQQEMPAFSLKESGPHEPFLKQGKTEPPKHFTEATLLSAMETAGKTVEDEVLKEALKQKGLGTPATRAAIIETLLKRGYIVREKKTLKTTDLGKYLIALIQDPQLKSPELTGEWEAKLKSIEQGKFSPLDFMKEISEYIRLILRGSDVFSLDEAKIGNCPLCKAPVIAGKKGYGCSRWKEGCAFVLWKEYQGIVLSYRQVQSLLQHKILLDPFLLAGRRVVLYLSSQGHLREMCIPEAPSSFVKKKGSSGIFMGKDLILHNENR